MLGRLGERELAARQLRRPGQKEERFTHLLSDELEDEPERRRPRPAWRRSPPPLRRLPPTIGWTAWSARSTTLKAQVAELRAELGHGMTGGLRSPCSRRCASSSAARSCGRSAPAVRDGDRTWTYAEHQERVRRAAGACAASSASSPATAWRRCCRTSRRCSSCTTPCPAPAACSSPSTRAWRATSTPTCSSTRAPRRSSPTARSRTQLDDGVAARVVWTRRVRAAARRGRAGGARAPRGRARAALDQLHLGHHRAPEGRHDDPPRRLPARARGDRRGRADAAQLLPVDAADVPLQRLGVPVGGDRDGRAARVPAEGRGQARSGGRCARRASRTCAPRRPCSR